MKIMYLDNLAGFISKYHIYVVSDIEFELFNHALSHIGFAPILCYVQTNNWRRHVQGMGQEVCLMPKPLLKLEKGKGKTPLSMLQTHCQI